MAQNDWYVLGQAISQASTITSSEIGDDQVSVDEISANLWAYIPHEATIVQSTKSSNNEWIIEITLRDGDGTPYAKKMPVRVYIGSTDDAGSAVSSTSFTSFTVAASATSSGGGPSATLAGLATSTQTANADLSFLCSSAGLLTLSAVLTTDAATTDAIHVIWAGGTYRSSDTIGSTTVAT